MNVRGTFLIAAVVLALAVGVATGQAPVKVNDVLDHWAKALGGKDNLRKVTGMYVKAVIVAGGQIGTLENWQTSKGEYKTIVSIGDHEFITVCDGHGGWASHDGTVTDLSDDALAAAVTRGYMGSYAHFFPERQTGEVEWVREDADAYVVKVEPKGGMPMTFYLDKNTGLPTKHEVVDSGRELTFFYDEWKDYGNVKTWRRGRQTAGDPDSDLTVTTQEVRWSPPIDPKIFQRPGPAPDSSQK
jgi:outer membrane lipoprotein-sorting protein